MNIVVVEGDYWERIGLEGELRILFPNTNIKVFDSIGTFLEAYQNMEKPFLLILEPMSPLFQIKGPEDSIEQRAKDLTANFSWLNRNLWRDILIEKMSEADNSVIVYTDVDQSLFFNLHLKGVRFCAKKREFDNLTKILTLT